ncbi:MAG: DNA polymerase III subunit delta [Anaerolineae bacterium]
MSKPTPTFYLLHGDDDLTLREEVARLRARLAAGADPTTAEMNTTLLDGREATLAEVRGACETMPFLAARRLVIVEGMLANARSEVVQALADYLPTLPPWARLVFVEPKRLPDSHALVKLARTHESGFERAFDPPSNAVGWIRKRAAQYGAEITPRAAATLAELVGEDLHAAASELDKLATYVDGARAIDVDDVARLTPYVPEANIFEMVDAVVRGDATGAVARMHRLMDEGDPLGLLGMIVRQFRLLIMAKAYLDAGYAPDGLAEALDVHPYAARKLPAQARNFSMETLEAIYRRLLDYDVQIKTGRIKPELALDLLVATLAG